jgi:hypothetical protein
MPFSIEPLPDKFSRCGLMSERGVLVGASILLTANALIGFWKEEHFETAGVIPSRRLMPDIYHTSAPMR